MFEDLDDNEFIDEEFSDADEAPEEESNNRIFLIIAAIVGGIFLIAVLCLGGVLYSRNASGATEGRQTEAAQATADQREAAIQAEGTQIALAWTDTPTVTPEPTDTPVPTSVVVLPSATPAEATENPATATIAALLTQAASQPTTDPSITITAFPTPTGLPSTGFFDDYGPMGLIALAFFAIVVIFLARRLRTSDR